MEGLAAACAACDVVITVSSVAAHLAGALGCRVWLLAPKSRGRFWYWFHGKTESPWYASVRIFEQHVLGQWGSVLSDVGRELHDLCLVKREDNIGND
jgi:ADP-heptose:LPS heptosyltransferase